MVLFGLVAALKGPAYGMGNLMHMGPGYMPTALGILLVILGVTISGAAVTKHDPEEERILPEHPEWFAWACILAGPLAFIVFGKIGGMIPGTFMCIFVSALGDREATWKGAVGVATVVTTFGVLLFHNVLKIPMPVLTWNLPL